MKTLNQILYSPPDLDAAADAWGANCGAGAIAALLGKPLCEIRPHLGEFERRGFMNPTHVIAALHSLGIRARGDWERPPRRPMFGMMLIQWGGRWLDPGVPVGAAYRHTHWIAVYGPAVYDVNCGWVKREEWERPGDGIAAVIAQQIPRCDGTWYPRVSIDIEGEGRVRL